MRGGHDVRRIRQPGFGLSLRHRNLLAPRMIAVAGIVNG